MMDEVSHKWDSLALSLHFEEHVIRTIARNYSSDCEGACRDMFGRWLDGDHCQPATWETLIRALCETDVSFKPLVNRLVKILCGTHAESPSDDHTLGVENDTGAAHMEGNRVCRVHVPLKYVFKTCL